MILFDPTRFSDRVRLGKRREEIEKEERRVKVIMKCNLTPFSTTRTYSNFLIYGDVSWKLK